VSRRFVRVAPRISRDIARAKGEAKLLARRDSQPGKRKGPACNRASTTISNRRITGEDRATT
jgi:hypothetical protein